MELNGYDILFKWGIVFCVVVSLVSTEEMTFELPDNERMCFHEVIPKDISCVLEFQVVEGGNYDVDVVLSSPSGGTLYLEQKKQLDQYTWMSEEEGEYKFCFSNEFSTFTHKMIYFNFQTGEDKVLVAQTGSPATAMTQLETTIFNMNKNLNLMVGYQTHMKLREAQGRSFAEELNERVQYWSFGQTLIILFTGIGQIVVLRSFFSDRKH